MASLVMPVLAVKEIVGKWVMGELGEFWGGWVSWVCWGWVMGKNR